MSAHDDLPTWIAHAVARGNPLESPDEEALRAPVQAWVELAVVRLLCEVCADLDALPFTVESAMRLAMADEMDLEAWLDVYAALEHTGITERLGLPSDLPSDIVASHRALGGTQDTTVMRWLQRLDEGTPTPELVIAAAAVARVTSWQGAPLAYVHSMTEVDGGFDVLTRPLVGTGYPDLHRSHHATAPPLRARSLWFWDGADEAIAVPRWLALWDDDTRLLRLWGGRDRSGQGLYPTRQRDGDVLRVPRIADDLPPFLGEPTWNTPAPAPRGVEVVRTDNDDTAAFVRREPSASTQRMADHRAHTPLDRTPELAPPGARLILRVQSGPDLMRFVPIEADHDVIAGRNQGFATFVLHHHQISRSHTRVRLDEDGHIGVQDLKSTNGTHLNGRPVATDRETEARPGDVVHVGPVPCRIEWATPDREARLLAVQALRDEERRDTLTRLLLPRHLIDQLPPSLHDSFRDGGTATAAPVLWGVLLYVDRLTAMHAQHGERVADRVFRSVARVLQASVDDPGRWVRVGYGELLYPLVGASEDDARAEAERLVLALQDHPWEDPIREVTLTGALAAKAPAESAQDWLHRARLALQEGRSKHGRGRVYVAT